MQSLEAILAASSTGLFFRVGLPDWPINRRGGTGLLKERKEFADLGGRRGELLNKLVDRPERVCRHYVRRHILPRQALDYAYRWERVGLAGGGVDGRSVDRLGAR
jgi:hypothetical protein